MTIITDKHGNMINVEAVMGDKEDTEGHKMIIDHILDLGEKIEIKQKPVVDEQKRGFAEHIIEDSFLRKDSDLVVIESREYLESLEGK